jgi:hypothetical protein
VPGGSAAAGPAPAEAEAVPPDAGAIRRRDTLVRGAMWRWFLRISRRPNPESDQPALTVTKPACPPPPPAPAGAPGSPAEPRSGPESPRQGRSPAPAPQRAAQGRRSSRRLCPEPQDILATGGTHSAAVPCGGETSDDGTHNALLGGNSTACGGAGGVHPPGRPHRGHCRGQLPRRGRGPGPARQPAETRSTPPPLGFSPANRKSSCQDPPDYAPRTGLSRKSSCAPACRPPGPCCQPFPSSGCSALTVIARHLFGDAVMQPNGVPSYTPWHHPLLNNMREDPC